MSQCLNSMGCRCRAAGRACGPDSTAHWLHCHLQQAHKPWQEAGSRAARRLVTPYQADTEQVPLRAATGRLQCVQEHAELAPTAALAAAAIKLARSRRLQKPSASKAARAAAGNGEHHSEPGAHAAPTEARLWSGHAGGGRARRHSMSACMPPRAGRTRYLGHVRRKRGRQRGRRQARPALDTQLRSHHLGIPGQLRARVRPHQRRDAGAPCGRAAQVPARVGARPSARKSLLRWCLQAGAPLQARLQAAQWKVRDDRRQTSTIHIEKQAPEGVPCIHTACTTACPRGLGGAGPRLQVGVADLGEDACLVAAVRQPPDQLQVVRRHRRHLRPRDPHQWGS